MLRIVQCTICYISINISLWTPNPSGYVHNSHVPEVEEQRDPETIELIRFLWVVERYHATDLA